MARSTDGRTTKQEDYYIDSDAEEEQYAELHAEQEQNIEQHICSQEDHMAIAQENREMKSIIQRLQTQLRQEIHTSYRLRQLRDQYRFTAKELSDQMARLQPKEEEEEMYDSDDEWKESVGKKVESLLRHTKKGLSRQRFAPVSPALNTNLAGQGFAPASPPFHTKSGLEGLTGPRFAPVSPAFGKRPGESLANSRFAPVSPVFNTKPGLEGLADPRFASVSQGTNKYYTDVDEFHGDASKWEAWQLHLQAKFRASAMLFPTEQSRIDYIRDHCKSTAFDIIKTRCLNNTTSPYVTAQEMLEDLDNMYGEFDPYGTSDARLHDPDFNMKKKQTFDEFLAKYTATIAPLQLSEQQKISHLTRTITRRLRWYTMGQKPKAFKDYVKQLRQCDINLRLADRQHEHDGSHADHRQDDGYSTDSSHSSRTSKTSSRNGSRRGYHGTNVHSKEFLEQLRQQGKCFRCQKTGHMAMDENAPCRGKKIKEKAVEKD
ncbi:MAG: hypothetical protein ASARMPREDX12_000676 [Alectoria sarmentosa]|nr:MAG: hypothetical protein ASARMPREDX12_000676 [Alectoria sarmentosa]